MAAESIASFRLYLSRKQIRLTREREVTARILLEDIPSGEDDELIQHVMANHPHRNVQLASVIRTLALLRESGILS